LPNIWVQLYHNYSETVNRPKQKSTAADYPEKAAVSRFRHNQNGIIGATPGLYRSSGRFTSFYVISALNPHESIEVLHRKIHFIAGHFDFFNPRLRTPPIGRGNRGRDQGSIAVTGRFLLDIGESCPISLNGDFPRRFTVTVHQNRPYSVDPGRFHRSAYGNPRIDQIDRISAVAQLGGRLGIDLEKYLGAASLSGDRSDKYRKIVRVDTLPPGGKTLKYPVVRPY
jgi:hypothetical protein